MSTTTSTTGNFKDAYDIRDLNVTFRAGTVPASVDLRRTHAITVYSQGRPPTCTAHAAVSAFEILQNGRTANTFLPSRSFVYYNTRVLENTVSSIVGTSLRNALRTLTNQGVCEETTWPYDTTRLLIRPHATAYSTALPNRIIRYARLAPTLTQIRLCLASGHPFAFAMKCYDHWYKAVGGRIPPTVPTTAKPLGGHAMVCVGYNDSTQTLTVLNSWGATWGDKGYAHIPYSLFFKPGEAWDMWVVMLTTTPPTATISR